MSAKAAYRSGAGLVQIVTPDENRAILQMQLPEAILTTYQPDGLDQESERLKIIDAVSCADAIVVGPGIGRSDAARTVVDLVLENSQIPLIIDADALNILSDRFNEAALPGNDSRARISAVAQAVPEGSILTPHLKELARLLDKDLAEIKADLLGICGVLHG